ncbi:MAG: hypothetical protein GXP47_03135 [Acidobacteria bacterium]|nr:hypothetical protein [Acidobacteriota bacterium]
MIRNHWPRWAWVTVLAVVAMGGLPPASADGPPVRADGAVQLRPPVAPASEQNPAFSPDGTRIVFTRFDNGYNIGPASINMLDLASGTVTRLTPLEDQDSVNLPGMSWHPDLDSIVFASDRSGADDLWAVRPDGSALTRLTRHAGAPYFIEPSWSPDGKWIVFEADRPVDDGGFRGEIWKVRADGSGLAALTSDEDFDDRQPNWSPTGERILFQRHRPGEEDWDIFTIRPDGSDLLRTTATPSSDTDASFSPDGRWIVYSSDYGGLPAPNIFVIPATGGTPVRVTRTGANEDGAPSFSPDGRWIAFESHPGQDEDTPASLWRIAAPAVTGFTWPRWSKTARLAGMAFEPGMSDAEIAVKLDRAAADGVSVLVVDGPTGWSYTAWTREEEFQRTLALFRDRVVPRAHARGLRVVWYLTSLELICGRCVGTGLDPSAEHPDWLQVDRFGNPVQFSGVQDVFWLEPDDLDAWLTPESSYGGFYVDRIRELAGAGMDGLWVDVAYYLNGLGPFEDLWPSTDSATASAFTTQTGHPAVPAKRWADPVWREWIRWRERSIAGFVRHVAAAAHAVAPGLLVFTENWGIDSNFVTQYAQDPLDFLADPGVATAHELEPVDQDNRGMLDATLEQWRSYALMVRFAAASDSGRPAWILSYAGGVDDSLREAAVHLAEGACFYEARGPEMLDDTTGSRPLVFPWLAKHMGRAADSSLLADVALWYSPRSRDFVDQESSGGDKFDTGGTTYLATYRHAGQTLIEAGVPFDIVTGRSTSEMLAHFRWLVLPGAACLSNAEVSLIRRFVAGGGRLAGSGQVGTLDHWGEPRATVALEGLPLAPLTSVESSLLSSNLSLEDRGSLLIRAREGVDSGGPFLLVVLANLDRSRDFENVKVTVRPSAAMRCGAARWSTPDIGSGTMPVTVGGARLTFTIPRVKTGAAVVLHRAPLARRPRARTVRGAPGRNRDGARRGTALGGPGVEARPAGRRRSDPLRGVCDRRRRSGH